MKNLNVRKINSRLLLTSTILSYVCMMLTIIHNNMSLAILYSFLTTVLGVLAITVKFYKSKTIVK